VASIDPLDSPAAAMRMKQVRVASVTTPDEMRAWHLLTGSEGSIARLAHATGFRYGYDANTHQYAHPTGVMLVTPQGTIARYFAGLEFTADALRVALRDAAQRRIASPSDFVQLLCFHVAAAGRYTAEIMQALRLVTLSALVVALAVVLRIRRRDSAAKRP
ncbi:MAG TPA: SCO family protein, partial [Casimicrobiaceae bacterium]|nr:SCO family protein [Casimicrobiaceae bacterium]